MRASKRWVAGVSLLGILSWTGIAGCEQPRTESEVDGATDRFARKYLPYEEQWIRESQIPEEPQESPWMVIWEVSEFDPGVPATPEQMQAANDLVTRCYDSALEHGWFDREKGLRDGFQLSANDKRHHRKDEYVLDGVTLDPDRPEYLMYYDTEDGRQALVAFMFLADAPESRGPQIAGPLAVWHHHIWNRKRCWVQGLLSAGSVGEDGQCEEGAARSRSPEMLHVWLIPRRVGPFSSGMGVPPQVLENGLRKRMAERGY